DEFRVDDAGDARQEIRRRSIIDRNDDDSGEQAAPERDHPLGTVFAEEDDFVATDEALRRQSCGEATRRAADFFVGVRTASKAVVVYQKLAPRAGEVLEEIDQRVATHVGIMLENFVFFVIFVAS